MGRVGVLFLLCEFADKANEGPPRAQIFARLPGCLHGFDFLLAGIDPEHQFFVRHCGPTELRPQFREGWIRLLPMRPSPGPWAAEDLVLDIRIHELSALPTPNAQRVLDGLVGDFLVPLF